MRTDPSPDGRDGWLLAVIGGLALVFTFGTPFSYGIFLEPLSVEYQITALSIATVFSLHLFAAYSIAGLLGIVATRYPVRIVLWALGGVTAVLAPALFVVDSVLGLVVVFTLLGTTIGLSVIVIVSVIPQWFDAYRGVATGILFVGIGLSLFILPPGWAIAIAALGIQSAFLLVVGLTAVSFIVAGIVCRHPPWIEQTPGSLGEITTWVGGVVRTRSFQWILLGIGLAFTWYYLLAGFGIALFEHRGLDRAAASFAFGLIGGISIVSRLGSGMVADRIGYGRTYLMSLAGAVIGCLLLMFSGVSVIYLAVMFFGMSLGGVTTLYVPIVVQRYDPAKSTAVVGIVSIGLGVTALAAPPAAIVLVSVTESFIPVTLVTLVSVVAAMICIRLGTTPG